MTADEIVEPDDSYIYTPRGYQEEALRSIRDLYQSGANRSLVFFATGLGKSSGVMMHLPMRFPHHVRDHGFLFLAHRRKILFQAYDKFRKAYPNLWVGLEMGEHEAVGQEDAVFASVESLGREYQNRIEKYSHRHFGVIVADEGHHVQEASTWDRILNYFGVGSDEDKHYKIGVQGEQVRPLSVFLTATPNRADGKTLAPFVDEVASEMSIVDGIEGGWLTDIKAHRAYKRGMDSLTEQEEIDFVVETFRKYLRDERTLVFARSVDQSRHIVHNLNEHGWAEAAHIDHKTETEERKEIYEAFENGGIDALSNRLVLCLDEETEILTREGWVGIDEMSYENRVANYWQDDGSVTWEKPKDIVRRSPVHNEKMVVADSGRQNFRVSRWHNMIVQGHDEKVWAEDLVGKQVRLPMAGDAEPETLNPEQPQRPSVTRSRFIAYTSHSYRKRLDMEYSESRRQAEKSWEDKMSLTRKAEFTDEELMFAGFWVGDGTRTELSGGGVEYSVTQSKKYRGIVRWFDRIIERCGFDVVRYDKGDHIRWSFGRGTGGINQKVSGVYPIEHLLNKDGSDALWSLSKFGFRAFVQGLWMADGDHGQARSVSGGPWIIHNTNEQLIDTLQAIASTRGFGSRKNRYERDIYAEGRIFYLWISHRNYWSSGDNSIRMEQEPSSDERLWCVTTDSGNIITRRKGRVTVMGNTEGYDNPAITAILDNAPTDRKALHIQKLGRGLRPHPTAKVDKYDTAEERKAAIKASEKPYLTYITTFDPTKHTLDVVAVLCETEENDEEVSIICSEVVDVLEEYDVEDEDFEISSEEDVRSINVKLQSANVFTQTIENPELQALTKLNWVVEGQSAAIRMDTTPFANTSTYRKAPCVVEFEPSGEGVFEMRIMSGGWNGTVPAKVKKHVTEVKAEDLHECIRRMDATIRDRDETLYHSLKRGSSESASQEQKDYLDRKDVAYSEPLSDETAQILINREKIKQRRQSANG